MRCREQTPPQPTSAPHPAWQAPAAGVYLAWWGSRQRTGRLQGRSPRSLKTSTRHRHFSGPAESLQPGRRGQSLFGGDLRLLQPGGRRWGPGGVGALEKEFQEFGTELEVEREEEVRVGASTSIRHCPVYTQFISLPRFCCATEGRWTVNSWPPPPAAARRSRRRGERGRSSAEW